MTSHSRALGLVPILTLVPALILALTSCDDDNLVARSSDEAAVPTTSAHPSTSTSPSVTESERAAAAAAAEEVVETAFSYDAEKYDDVLDEATPLMTTSMAAEFEKTHEGIRDVAMKSGARQSADVVAKGVVSADDEVQVLVFANLTTTTPPKGNAARSQTLLVTLVDEGGAWLMDDVLTGDLSPKDETDPERAEAISAASDMAEAFSNLSASSVDADTEAVMALATGQFLEQYQKSLPGLKRLTRKNQSTMSGQVAAAGLVELHGDQAVVLVATTGSVTNSATQGKETARDLRIRITLARVDDDWLASELEFVS